MQLLHVVERISHVQPPPPLLPLPQTPEAKAKAAAEAAEKAKYSQTVDILQRLDLHAHIPAFMSAAAAAACAARLSFVVCVVVHAQCSLFVTSLLRVQEGGHHQQGFGQNVCRRAQEHRAQHGQR